MNTNKANTKRNLYESRKIHKGACEEVWHGSIAKPMATPMHPTSKLNKDEDRKNIDERKYRAMIGSLMYLTSLRPDISFNMGLCSRFQSNPKESHLMVVKKMLRYHHGT